MSAVYVSIGLLIRTLLLFSSDFTWADARKVATSILAGIFFAFVETDIRLLPIVFATMIAFFYKDKIIPYITEGTLLLYGLVAIFVYLKSNTGQTLSEAFEQVTFFCLVLYSLIMFVLCVTKIRLSIMVEIFMVILFFLVSIYIAYQATIKYLVADTSPPGLILLGFFSLIFISNTIYLLKFIPIPSNHKTFEEVLKEVARHASDIEKKYIDIDIHLSRTLGIVGLFIFTIFFDVLFNDWLLALAIFIGAGGMLLDERYL